MSICDHFTQNAHQRCPKICQKTTKKSIFEKKYLFHFAVVPQEKIYGPWNLKVSLSTRPGESKKFGPDQKSQFLNFSGAMLHTLSKIVGFGAKNANFSRNRVQRVLKSIFFTETKFFRRLSPPRSL